MIVPFCDTPFKIELLGFLAGAFSTLAFLPQAFLVWKTKSTRDISLGMYSLYVCSLILWGAYACLIDSWCLLITELVTLVIALYILMMKLKEN
jgi:MtN3 and saliva related transmembrane protein